MGKQTLLNDFKSLVYKVYHTSLGRMFVHMILLAGIVSAELMVGTVLFTKANQEDALIFDTNGADSISTDNTSCTASDSQITCSLGGGGGGEEKVKFSTGENGEGQLTICDPSDSSNCITILDKNLGATSNDISSTDSRGYHYKWGNNIGILWSESSYTFGGLSEGSSWTEGGQGPCPEGYHIPTATEWTGLLAMWRGAEGHLDSADDVIQFNSDFKIPMAGRRSLNSNVNSLGTIAFIWTSTPTRQTFVSNISSNFTNIITSSANYGNSIRCFKDVPVSPTSTMAAPEITRDGWTIVGWSSNSGATTAEYSVGDDIPLNTGTLYAITKKEVEYTATLDLNGADSLGEDSVACTGMIYNTDEYAQNCTIMSPDITRDGGIVIGWSSNSGSKVAEYTTGENVDLTGDITLYAITSEEYSVTFDSNGVDGIGANSASCMVYNTESSCSSMGGGGEKVVASVGTNGEGQLTICDPSDSSNCITMLDKNLGASVAGTGVDSYGDYYKWGNNQGYSSLVSNADFLAAEVGEWIEGDQGPCDAGYHIPSLDEWNVLMNMWAGETVEYLYPTQVLQFQRDFKIPFAGGRGNYDGSVYVLGFGARLWSSSGSGDYTRIFTMESPEYYMYDFAVGLGQYNRTLGSSLRCFKNEPESLNILAPEITRDGWTVVGWSSDSGSTTAEYQVGDTIELSNNTTLYAITQQPQTTQPSGGSSTVRRNNKSEEKADENVHGAATEQTEGVETEGVKNEGEDEVLDAYKWAYDKSITTMSSIDKANPDGYVIRGHMAKMVVNFVVNSLGKEIPSEIPAECEKWNDKKGSWENDEIREYATKACALGLMGINMPNDEFRPNETVSRAQFGTVLSRILRGDKYNVDKDSKTPYYRKHLSALKGDGIMTQIENPEKRYEIRKRVWVMFMRSQE